MSRATPVALLPRPNGTSLVIKTDTRSEDGELVNEQYVTEFFRGVATESGIGERAPDHRLEVDGDPVAEVTYSVADDQTVRYAAASGDDFAIHLDDAFAQQVGLPGRIVHGLCTMAFAGRAVLEAAGIDDPSTVKRIAVRFSAPLFPGESVTTRVWHVDGAFGFESLNSRAPRCSKTAASSSDEPQRWGDHTQASFADLPILLARRLAPSRPSPQGRLFVRALDARSTET